MIRSLICMTFAVAFAASCGKMADPPKTAAPASGVVEPSAGVAASDDPEEPGAIIDPEEPAVVDPAEPVAAVDPEEPAPGVEPADPVEPLDHVAAGAVADPSVCAALVAKEFELVRASGTEEMRKSYDAANPTEATARCQKHRTLQSVVDCTMNATSALELYRTCVPLAFVGRDLTVGRTFQARADNSGADPEVFALDGDTVEFGRCKMIHQQVEQYRGFFISCGGKTVGPITTGDDIRAAMAELSKDSAAGHSAVMGIINNYPRGGSGRWRVCDASGNCRIE